MTLEEMFCDLYDKYGKDFNWYLLPLTQADGAFVVELNKEIGQGHFLSGKKIRAVAKCDSNDDVLYVVRSGIARILLSASLLSWIEGWESAACWLWGNPWSRSWTGCGPSM